MAQQTDYAALYAEVSTWQHERGLELIRKADPRPGEVVVDLGCGTGGLTTALARRVLPGGRVLGVDPDEARLQVARASRPPDLERLGYIDDKAESLPWLPDGSVDLVFSNYALHWVPDKAAVVREALRYLRPGGRLAFELGGCKPIALWDQVNRLAGCADGVHVSTISSLSADGWRRLLSGGGFVEVAVRALDFDLAFPDAAAFFDWQEATSHGDFRRSALPEADRRRIEARFAGGGSIAIPAVRATAVKPA